MLVTCPECGKKRSDEAEFCPHCGCKRTEQSFSGGCGAIVLFALIMFAFEMCSSDTAKTYMTKNNVNYRDAPNGTVLGQLPKGTKIPCAVDNGWCKTTKDSRDVYISLKVLVENDQRKETPSAQKRPSEDVSVRQKKGLIAAIGE